MSHELVSDAAADAVEQEAEARVFQHAAVAGGGEPLEVRGGVLVGRTSRTERHITELSGCLAELRGVRERSRVVDIRRETGSGIEAFEETAEASGVGLWLGQHDHSRRLPISGPGARVGAQGVSGGEAAGDDPAKLLEQVRSAPPLARLDNTPP